jgi:hypothetical protein
VEVSAVEGVSPEQQQIVRLRLIEALRQAPGFGVSEAEQTAAELNATLRRSGQSALLVLFVIADARPTGTLTEAKICLLPGEALVGAVPIKLSASEGTEARETTELLEHAAQRSGEKILENLSAILDTAKVVPAEQHGSCREPSALRSDPEVRTSVGVTAART